jgi:hypothetical protein
MDIKVESDDKRVKIVGRGYADGAVYTIHIDDVEFGGTPDLGRQPSFQMMLSYMSIMGPTIRLEASRREMQGKKVYQELLKKVKEKAEEEKKK